MAVNETSDFSLSRKFARRHERFRTEQHLGYVLRVGTKFITSRLLDTRQVTYEHRKFQITRSIKPKQ